MVGNGEAEAGNGHQDWQSELGNQQPDEARLDIQIKTAAMKLKQIDIESSSQAKSIILSNIVKKKV